MSDSTKTLGIIHAINLTIRACSRFWISIFRMSK